MSKRYEVQPYFRAFMIERGYHDSSDADNRDYMAWNQERWAEFERATGRPVNPVGLRRFYAAEFAAWLETRSIDFLAREAVEAA